MISAPLVLLVTGIAGMAGLFALKLVELRRGSVFFASVRRKCDRATLQALRQLEKRMIAWYAWRPPVILPYAAALMKGAYALTHRVIENKPMRLTGVAYSKGYYATERVSKYLREVSKSKERAASSTQNVIED